MKLGRLAKSLSADVNVKRRAKGLLPRPVGSNMTIVCLYLLFLYVTHTLRSVFCIFTNETAFECFLK